MTIDFPPHPHTTLELLTRIRQRTYDLGQILSSISEPDLLVILVDWSVKDHLAHLAAWHGAARAALTGEPRHEALGLTEPPPDPRDFEAMNVVLHLLWQSKSFTAVQEAFRTSQANLLGILSGIPDRQLQTAVEDNPDGNTLVQVLSADTYEHYIEHGVWIRQQLAASGR